MATLETGVATLGSARSDTQPLDGTPIRIRHWRRLLAQEEPFPPRSKNSMLMVFLK